MLISMDYGVSMGPTARVEAGPCIATSHHHPGKKMKKTEMQ